MGKATGKTLNRRDFLAASATAVVTPLILPQGVLAAPGRPGANDRVITGHIGVGGMGSVHVDAMKDQIAVVCDVDDERITRAQRITGRDNVDGEKDWRRVIERNDIDAVVIASPDHWHAVMTVAACEAGKDVYCEKPACKTHQEMKAMVDAARRYDRVVQVGSQGRSNENAWAACQYLRNGQIGKVDFVDIWHVNNWVGGDPAKFGPAPDSLDWDMWLGPSPWREYNPDYVHFNFRWMMDWGQGFVRDRGAHVLSLIYWFLEMDGRWPTRVKATGTPQKEGLWDVPEAFECVWEYEDPRFVISWKQPGVAAVDHDFGAVYHGDKGTLIVPGGDGWTDVEQKAKDYTPEAGGVVPYKSPGHREDWLKCIATRERPIMDIAYGAQIAQVCNMAVLSYQFGRPLEWDAEKEQFVNDDEANRALARPGRGIWQL
jgi:predicted dehydrogenase